MTAGTAAVALGHYETAPRRTRKGVSTFEVTARHTRYVTGADATDEIRTTSSFDLVHDADAWIRANDPDAGTFPALLGTEARAFAEVIHAGNGATDDYGVARHRSDITDGLSGLDPRMVKAWADEALTARPSAPYTARQQPRYSVGSKTNRRRASDPGTPRHIITLPSGRERASYHAIDLFGRSDGKATPYSERGGEAIVSLGHDPSYVWVGHTKHVRTRKAGAARVAKHREAVKASAPRPDWQDAADELSAMLELGGEPITCQGVRIVTGPPDATGRYRATLTYLDGQQRTIRTRTVAPIARALVNV